MAQAQILLVMTVVSSTQRPTDSSAAKTPVFGIWKPAKYDQATLSMPTGLRYHLVVE